MGAQQPENESIVTSQQVQAIIGHTWWLLKSDWRRLPSVLWLWLAIPLFFLPWINVSCNGRNLGQQSGLQSCWGGIAPALELEAMQSSKTESSKSDKENIPWSFLSCLYILSLLLACFIGLGCVVCVLVKFSWCAAVAHVLTLGLGGFCVLLLLIQMLFGFPLDRKVRESMSEMQSKEAAKEKASEPFAGLGAAIEFRTSYTFWLWLTLFVTLASVPFFLLESALLGYKVAQTIRTTDGARDTG